VKFGSFEFNLRELAGSMGDFGTLFPLAIGYIVVCGLNPAGFLVMMGLANIATGLFYRLPMPIEPMKVLAVVAIAQRWTPSMVYASGFTMGVVWLALGLSGVMGWIARVTPRAVVRGIQVALGVLLALKAFDMIASWWALGLVSIVLALLLRRNRYAPGAIVLVLVGLLIMWARGQLAGIATPGLHLPQLTTFEADEVWQALVVAGFAQIPLTATNAVISTSSLIKTYWPERTVTEKQLSLNMGIMNAVAPFLGGMPMCHGAGGLAGQYYFGARTGGANIIEGLIEIFMGLFLAASIAQLLLAFPTAIIGAMLLLVGIELARFATDVRLKGDLAVLGITVVVSVAANMALGFVAGVAAHYLLERVSKHGRSEGRAGRASDGQDA
jgi:MFS superfamily sulfate permease-like transporter